VEAAGRNGLYLLGDTAGTNTLPYSSRRNYGQCDDCTPPCDDDNNLKRLRKQTSVRAREEKHGDKNYCSSYD
jgi:hypothetical protein